MMIRDYKHLTELHHSHTDQMQLLESEMMKVRDLFVKKFADKIILQQQI